MYFYKSILYLTSNNVNAIITSYDNKLNHFQYVLVHFREDKVDCQKLAMLDCLCFATGPVLYTQNLSSLAQNNRIFYFIYYYLFGLVVKKHTFQLT